MNAAKQQQELILYACFIAVWKITNAASKLSISNSCSFKQVLPLQMAGTVYVVGVEVYHRVHLDGMALPINANDNYLTEISCNNNHIFLR
jgi:hypothetical protein